MRSAALIAVCLACLALSCRMDCGLGTGGVGCESSGTQTGTIACLADTDCLPGQFCSFVFALCSPGDSGVILPSRIHSSRCERVYTETLGMACTSSDDCAPAEDCLAGTCKLPDSCGTLVACRSGCALKREAHSSCDVCVCDC